MTPLEREREDYEFAKEHIAYRERQGRGYPSMLADIDKWPLKGIPYPNRDFTIEVYAQERCSWRGETA